MTYSIIGSGAIGSALAGHFASKGIEVSLANNRGPGSLTDIVGKLGSKVKAATVEESILADVVILAVPLPAVPDAVSSISNWPFSTASFSPLEPHTSAETLAAAERKIRELKQRLDATGDRSTKSGSTPVFRT